MYPQESCSTSCTS